ncbi:MAG: tRNA preQ1(34) S-adenosylmethionine ribosyltransferase-isomerase QueA [Acidimicrobiia bacterium]|nr:tRNA preQ1(34) S-adenosylmethionine ribosyltransferase-isomerase QueA [Acidimicrobiia bacterium]
MRSEEFDYKLPPEAIAQLPAEPRDAARLLVVGDPLLDSTFSKLPDYLNAGDLLVVNTTRVRAARLQGTRPTGGSVELLLLTEEGGEWEALARPARKLRAGMLLDFGELAADVVAVGVEGKVRVRLHAAGDEAVEDVIAAVGAVPYPPYVTSGPADPDRYQTVYADITGSAAAPTAGLHFTSQLLADLEDRGIRRAEIMLDIGLDTFRPISAPAIEDHEMHQERYEVPAATEAAIRETRDRGGRVVAVGTTTVRALEAAAATGELVAGAGLTDLFITPGYGPRVVDAVLTNFHLPASSLIVMIAALLPGWRHVYEHALASGYRFLSFGDAMFIPDVHGKTR